MNDRIDLHIHSDRSSDGDCSPGHIVNMAKSSNLRAIAISDHDTVNAYPETIQYGEESGIEIIPSIELTTIFEGREFHLLCPFIDWKSEILGDLILDVAHRRRLEARERVEKLQKIGFDISWEELLQASDPFPPLGVTIAQLILDKAEKNKTPGFSKYLNGEKKEFAPFHFYKNYFMEGKPACARKRNVSLLDVMSIILSAGGVPVLAHPGAYFQNTKKEDLIRLKEHGLIGLEVYSSYHDAGQKSLYESIAEELDLIPTAGSDFHGSIKPHIHFGDLAEGGYWMVEKLKERRP
ncbi:PHP domain-containing protein [Acidobacteriota bacterium]